MYIITISIISLVYIIWLILILSVLASPSIRLLADAGSYGKLRNTLGDPGKDADADVSKEKQRKVKREEQKINVASASSNNLQSSSQQNPSAPSASILLHPSLYIRTSHAFLAYYAIAAVWNGALLLECVIAFSLSSFDSTPILRVLHICDHFLRTSHLDFSYLPSYPSSSASATSTLLFLQLLLFQAHLLRRIYETLYITRFSSASKQHVIVTIVGVVYYLLCSLTMVVDSSLFYQDEGAESGIFTNYPSMIYPCVTIGMAIFLAASAAQYRTHCILADLRRGERNNTKKSDDNTSSTSSSSSSSYSIPHGFLFTYISMPHYTCEILEYFGFYLLSGLKFSQLLIVIWVASNLTITGVRSHRWYHERWKEVYPKERYAILPGLI